MALNINSVTLAGHLTRDPETRTLPNGGSTVTSFSLAVNRRWKNAEGELKEEVTFVDCEAWGRVGETLSQYQRKGNPIYIEGRLKLDQWEDDNGQKRSRMKVVAITVQFLSTKGQHETGDADEGSAHAAPSTAASSTPAPTATTRANPGKPSRQPVGIPVEDPPF